MPRYEKDVIPACPECDSTEGATKVCKKCSVVYCKHYASVTDSRFCGNCIADISLKETIMEKEVEHVRQDGTVTFSRKYQARHLQLLGNDWLFSAHLIETMTDAEIDATIEYHRANVGLMLQERESRKLEKYKKLSGVRLTYTKRETQEEKEKREAKEAAKAAKVAGKRVKTSKKDLSADAIIQMLGQLSKAGITPEMIAAMAASKGKA